jgi:hypothetical protein
MKIALFCLEASRDDYGRLRFRFALCVVTTTPAVVSATLLTVV